MSAWRALLSLLWLLGALVSPMAATAHALSMPVPLVTPIAPPCHMDMADMAAKAPAHKPSPPIDSGLMPCCSQPAIMAIAVPPIPLPREIVRISLIPLPQQALVSRPRPIDPRPPKIA